MTPRRYFKKSFRAALPLPGLILTLLLAGSGCTSKYFFFPTDDRMGEPARAYEEVFFPSLDGTLLHAWFIPASGDARGTVVHFHGNAQNLSHHYLYVNWLADAGYHVFTFDYRGFGKSAGTPDLSGAVQDGLAALLYLRTRKDIDINRLLVFGQSIGGALATTVVGKYQVPGVAGVLLDSPLSSFRIIAREALIKMGYRFPLYHLPFLLVPDGNSPIHHVHKISPRPLLIVHGDADPIVDVSHSHRLFQKAAPPKRLVILPEVLHVDAFSLHLPATRALMLDFFERSLRESEIEE